MTSPTVPYARGRIEPGNIAQLRADSYRRHGHILRALRATPPAAYDCRTQTPAFIPVLEETDDDQAQCGSCWDFSGTEVAEAAMMKAGLLTLDQRLSKQYTLDCGKNGGCGGDDNTNVLQWAQDTGLPLSADYGTYKGSSGSCKYKSGMTLYKIGSWLFVDSNGGQGVTPTLDIKNALMNYGMIGCAVAAGSDWDNASATTTLTGRSTSIDHDVAIVGWDDNHDNGDGTKGAWIVRNSWGPSWAMGGYIFMKYGADSIGTGAVAAICKGPIPPPNPIVLYWLI